MGKNEDYSLGDSLSALRNCWEEIGVEVSIYVILVKAGMCSLPHFWAELLLVTRELLLVTRSRCLH